MLLELFYVTCCGPWNLENLCHISPVSSPDLNFWGLSHPPFAWSVPTLHQTDLIKVTASRAEPKLHCTDTHEGPEGSVSDNMQQQQQFLPIHNCVIIRGSGDSTNARGSRGPPGAYLQP